MKKFGSRIAAIGDGLQDSSKEVGCTVSKTLRTIDDKHEAITETIGDVAKATRVVAGVATVAAAIAAPTGLAAVGVALGLTSAPIVVVAAPVLVTVAGVAATVSAAAHLYSKSRRKSKEKIDASNCL